MRQQDHDNAFLKHLNYLIDSGKRDIEIPANIVSKASDEAIEEARRLCKLTGVRIRIRPVDFTDPR